MIIGIGNELRRDDNIGNWLAERLSGIAGYENPENLIGKIQKTAPKELVIIDAVEFPGKVGDVKLFKLDDIASQLSTTHNLPITLFAELLPSSRISVLGVKVADRGMGEGFSPEVTGLLPQIEAKARELTSSRA